MQTVYCKPTQNTSQMLQVLSVTENCLDKERKDKKKVDVVVGKKNRSKRTMSEKEEEEIKQEEKNRLSELQANPYGFFCPRIKNTKTIDAT